MFLGDSVEKFLGSVPIECSKVDFMTILYAHETIPWIDSMDVVYYGENVPRSFPTESKADGVIMSTNFQDMFPWIRKQKQLVFVFALRIMPVKGCKGICLGYTGMCAHPGLK